MWQSGSKGGCPHSELCTAARPWGVRMRMYVHMRLEAPQPRVAVRTDRGVELLRPMACGGSR